MTGDSSVPFPEFTAVVMLDDVVIGHYNADERSFVPASAQESVNVTEQITISTVFKGIHKGMKTKAYHLIDYLNYTRGNYSLMVLCSILLRVLENKYFHSDLSIMFINYHSKV